MITYDTLKELAHALSKITGFRYVAFRSENTTDLFIYFSKYKMMWYPQCESWAGELDRQILGLNDMPQLDWSQCLFDCKEEGN